MEFSFWKEYISKTGSSPETEYYRKFMMDMGDIRDITFFDNLVCLDIGCGPKGSLTWLDNALARIGIDPLAEDYMEFGISNHKMIYLLAKAEAIPLPTSYVDIVFSLNSLDHVDDVIAVCSEIRRVLKPGGFFIGSLNIDMTSTITEPFTLTEDFLQRHLFRGWEKEFYEIRPRMENLTAPFGPYKYFYENCPTNILNKPCP